MAGPDTYSIGDTHEKFLKDFYDNKALISPLIKTLDETAQASQTLLDANRDKRFTPEMKKQAEYDFIHDLVPNRYPDGKPMEKKKMEEIALILCSDFDSVYLSCPSIYSEALLFRNRTSDTFRVPTIQSSIDLQHQIPAFAYCDYVVSNDGFFCEGGKYVQKMFSERDKKRKFEIARKLSEIAALV